MKNKVMVRKKSKLWIFGSRENLSMTSDLSARGQANLCNPKFWQWLKMQDEKVQNFERME